MESCGPSAAELAPAWSPSSVLPGDAPRDLVVFSHLRWDGVWQRPQHLVSRLSRHFGRTWYVEEPVQRPGEGFRLRVEAAGDVRRVLVDVPPADRWLTFGEAEGLDHAAVVRSAWGELHRPLVWLYSPMALPIAQQVEPETLVYDVMDDLSAFRGAAPELRLRHAQALAAADLVFTGGRSIHDGVVEHRRRPAQTVCFPSGVDLAHFAHPRQRGVTPVAGYVGVVDERLDMGLLAGLAERLPEWTIRVVGPVIKVDEAVLPKAPNVEYLGMRSYAELPAIMAGFDVALMPFALNEATASISPTKTLEYLAAGLPTVSTRIRDVVRDCSAAVTLADDAEGFARACEEVRAGRLRFPSAAAAELMRRRSWDEIASRMLSLVTNGEDSVGDVSASA